MPTSWRSILVAVVAAGSVVACTEQGPAAPNTCDETIDNVTQSGNTLTATGDFNTGGQPILTLKKGAFSQVIPADTHDLTTATFDVTGVPPGVYSATWDLSCSGIATVTSHVSTITIQ